MIDTPDFKIVPKSEAEKRRLPLRPRRSWGPVIEALVAGRTLFLSDESLSESNIKYLQLALARRGAGEHLRTSRTVRDDEVGRDLWVVVGAGEMVPVGAVDA